MIVFLSYSTKDYFFAELLEIKLKAAGITLWRDQGSLLAGSEWRQGIEDGISNSAAVVVALSLNGAASPYVTYEWAYAMGKGIAVIPMKISDCQIHPRLEAIQHLDFTVPNALPWNLLIESINGVEVSSDDDSINNKIVGQEPQQDSDTTTVQAILNYLNQRGYQMASLERLRDKVDPNLDQTRFDSLIENNKSIFRKARLKGGKLGLAKIIP